MAIFVCGKHVLASVSGQLADYPPLAAMSQWYSDYCQISVCARYQSLSIHYLIQYINISNCNNYHSFRYSNCMLITQCSNIQTRQPTKSYNSYVSRTVAKCNNAAIISTTYITRTNHQVSIFLHQHQRKITLISLTKIVDLTYYTIVVNFVPSAQRYPLAKGKQPKKFQWKFDTSPRKISCLNC